MRISNKKYKKLEENTKIVITLNKGEYGIVDGKPAITVAEARRIAETVYDLAMEKMVKAGVLEITDDEKAVLDALWREQDIYLYRTNEEILKNADGKTTGWS